MKIAIRLIALLAIISMASAVELQAADLVKIIKSSKQYGYIKDIDNIDNIDFKEGETQYGEKQVVMITTFDNDDVIDDAAEAFVKSNKDFPKDILKRFDIRKGLKGIKPVLKTTFVFNSDDKIASVKTALFNGDAFLRDFQEFSRASGNESFLLNIQFEYIGKMYFAGIEEKIAGMLKDVVNRISKERVFVLHYDVVGELASVTPETPSHLLNPAISHYHKLKIKALLDARVIGDGRFEPDDGYGDCDGNIIYVYTENQIKDLMIKARKNGTYFECPFKSEIDFPIVILNREAIFMFLQDKFAYGCRISNQKDGRLPPLELSSEQFSREYFAWKKDQRAKKAEESQEDHQEDRQAQSSREEQPAARHQDQPVIADVETPAEPFTEYEIVPEVLGTGADVNVLILMRSGPDYELVLIDVEDDYPSKITVSAGGKKLEMAGGSKVWKVRIPAAEMKKMMDGFALVVSDINEHAENMSVYGSAADIPLLSAPDESSVAVDTITIKYVNFGDASIVAADGREFMADDEEMQKLRDILKPGDRESLENVNKDMVVFYAPTRDGMMVVRLDEPFLRRK